MNINYSLGKDYMVFTSIAPSVVYYLQRWEGLGFTTGEATTGTPFMNNYNPGDVINFNTLSATFIIDEEWKVYEQVAGLTIGNTPTESEEYEFQTTDIDLYLLNNNTKKTIGKFHLHDAFVEEVLNISNDYNTDDNTQVKTMTAIIRYQYHEFIRDVD